MSKRYARGTYSTGEFRVAKKKRKREFRAAKGKRKTQWVRIPAVVIVPKSRLKA